MVSPTTASRKDGCTYANSRDPYTYRPQQIAEIERFLRYVFQPGDLIEIRGLESPEFGVMRMLANDVPPPPAPP